MVVLSNKNQNNSLHKLKQEVRQTQDHSKQYILYIQQLK